MRGFSLTFLAWLLPMAGSGQARPVAAGPAPAARPVPPPVVAPPASPKPLPRDVGGLTLGRSVFAILADCQRLRYRASVLGDERTVTRRGVRYTLSALRVVTPPDSPITWARLSFLDGRLIGLRASFRKPNAGLASDADRDHGKASWQNDERVEWVDRTRSTAYSVWRPGDRVELADLAHARERGFLTNAEIDAMLEKRRTPPAPPRR